MSHDVRACIAERVQLGRQKSSRGNEYWQAPIYAACPVLAGHRNTPATFLLRDYVLLRQGRPLVAPTFRGAALGVLRGMNTQPHQHPTPHKPTPHVTPHKPTPSSGVGHPHGHGGGGKHGPMPTPHKPTAHHHKKHHKPSKSTAPRVQVIEGVELEWLPLLAKKLLIN